MTEIPDNTVILHFDFKLISKDNEKIQNQKGRYFLSDKYKSFEKQIKDTAFIQLQENYNSVFFENGVDLEMHIYTYFKTKVHPDMWNLPKSLADALQGIVYRNDRQIKSGKITITEGWERDSFNVHIKPL